MTTETSIFSTVPLKAQKLALFLKVVLLLQSMELANCCEKGTAFLPQSELLLELKGCRESEGIRKAHYNLNNNGIPVTV